MKSRLERKKIVLPTYQVGEAEPLPLFFEKRPYQGASGKLYPIPYVSEIADEKKDREYDGIVLENDYIHVVVLPELGGKIHSARDKDTGYDFIYNNKVIKPAMVGLAGPWVSGGIEFNWPQHHRPTTFMPLEVATEEKENEKTVYVGERDYFYRMKGMAALSVDDEHSYIKASVTVYNSTPEAHPFMWWANMAVEVNDDYKIVFPPDVEYVNDHDRRAVLEWPIAKGVYHTARPFDYGKGTDIHLNSAVRVPSSFMISRGQSEMDFVCGYDSGKNCGVVTVADHRIAPGKKLWTWGNGKFGKKWCGNLTDDGSEYVELMTGCYTDNQPDFTWIAPYETKTFEQYWYPVREIGEVKCANREGACNLEYRGKKLFTGFCPTSAGTYRVLLTDGGATLSDECAELSPQKPYLRETERLKKSEDLTLTVFDGKGKEVLSYRPPVRGNKKPITPRKPAPAPETVASTEELYLHGIHLRQYKHFAYRAEDYFLEALRRDEGDIRCNEAMGDISLERGEYEKAEKYYTAAIGRLTLRNCNPYDTKPYYGRALCRFYRGDEKGAYEDAYAAIWSYPLRSAGYYLLAKLELRRGEKEKAAEMLGLSLETNAKHLWARYIRSILTGESAETEISKTDPLFVPKIETEKQAIDFATELAEFGLYEQAKKIIEKAPDGAMKFYYLAYYDEKTGDIGAREKYIPLADACPWAREFPSKRESIDVLRAAGTPMANYYLGCIFYNFERYEEACAAWEKTVDTMPFAPAYRNLALGYYDHLSRPQDAKRCMEKARELMPGSDRIFYELTRLYTALNLPLKERLDLYESEGKLRRDDCTLNYSVLRTVAENYEGAEMLLKTHRFHTYEGGEGYLTQHHAWLKYLIARKLFKEGKRKQAAKEAESGLTFPENYGEEKNYFVNDAPLYLTLAECAEDEKTRKNYLGLAVSTKGAPTVHSYFECRALEKLGKKEEAERLAREMISIGKEKIRNAATDDYFGVGAPTYPPFGYDIVKAHTLSGSALCAFGELALGNLESAKAYAKTMREIDEADFALYLLRKEMYD